MANILVHVCVNHETPEKRPRPCNCEQYISRSECEDRIAVGELVPIPHDSKNVVLNRSRAVLSHAPPGFAVMVGPKQMSRAVDYANFEKKQKPPDALNDFRKKKQSELTSLIVLLKSASPTESVELKDRAKKLIYELRAISAFRSGKKRINVDCIIGNLPRVQLNFLGCNAFLVKAK